MTMTKVVKTGGVNVSEDVVKIKDLAPAKPVYPIRPSPAPMPVDGEALESQAIDDAAEMPLDEEFIEEPFTAAAPADMAAVEAVSRPAAGVAVDGGAIKEEIIQGAMAEAGRILEDAVHRAEAAKNEELAKVQQEADQLRQQAVEAGRKEGAGQVVAEVESATKSLEESIARYEGERAGFEAEYEEQLKWMALEVASKVLAKKVAEDDTEMLEMVKKAVQSVKNEPWVRVEVAQEMVHLIDQLSEAFAANANIEVSPIPAEDGTVHIETPSGVVDASLKTQLDNLRDYFATMQ